METGTKRESDSDFSEEDSSFGEISNDAIMTKRYNIKLERDIHKQVEEHVVMEENKVLVYDCNAKIIKYLLNIKVRNGIEYTHNETAPVAYPIQKSFDVKFLIKNKKRLNTYHCMII